MKITHDGLVLKKIEKYDGLYCLIGSVVIDGIPLTSIKN